MTTEKRLERIEDTIIDLHKVTVETRTILKEFRRSTDGHFKKINGSVNTNDNRLDTLETEHTKQKGIIIAIGAFVTVIINGLVWVFGALKG